jgi:hypothetical protein
MTGISLQENHRGEWKSSVTKRYQTVRHILHYATSPIAEIVSKPLQVILNANYSALCVCVCVCERERERENFGLNMREGW